jgi:hypothetical protein
MPAAAADVPAVPSVLVRAPRRAARCCGCPQAEDLVCPPLRVARASARLRGGRPPRAAPGRARARARHAARPTLNPTPRAQVYCYEDSKLLKVFQAIVRALYDADVLGEDTIIWWAKKGAHPKGRNVFQRDMEPFIKWLEEAEAEGDEEEDEE